MRINLGMAGFALTLLTLAADPARAQSSYSSVVLADNPTAYWHLNETNGTVAHDSASNYSGIYNDVTLAQPGFAAPVDPEYSTLFGPGPNSFVGGIPGLDLGSSIATGFSVECWLAGGPQSAGAAVISRGLPGQEQYLMDFGGTANGLRLMVRDTNSNFRGAASTYTLDGYWHHVVGVIDEAGINTLGIPTELLYVDGQVVGGDSFRGGVLAASPGTPTSIGSRQSAENGPFDLNFNGRIDELAVYKYPLTALQVASHFNAHWGTNTPPPIIIGSQPAVIGSVPGVSATLGVSAQGAPPLAYQWCQNGLNLTNETGSTLTLLAGEPFAAGNYTVVITNVFGSVTSSPVTVPDAVDLTSNLVLHLKFDLNYEDSSSVSNVVRARGSPSFIPGLIGAGAFSYSSDGGGIFNYATLGMAPALRFSSNVNFSVSYWIQYPNVPDNQLNGTDNIFPACDLPVLGTAVGSTYHPGYVFAQCGEGGCVGNPGAWIWTLNDGVTTYSAIGAPNSVDDGNWHNLVHTFDRTGSGITYLDGVQVAVSPIDSLGDLDNTNATIIGNDPTGVYPLAGAGNLDDLGVWQRVLTPAEAQSIFLGGLITGATFGIPTPAELTVYVKVVGPKQVQILWSGGTLISASHPQGPWTPVPGAFPPLLTVNITNTSQFYRVKQ